MELATQPLSDKTNTVIIVPVMDKSIKFMPLVKPLDSRLRPELVGVWNSPPVNVRHREATWPRSTACRLGTGPRAARAAHTPGNLGRLRGDKTPLELFLAGIRGWETGLRRQLDAGSH